MNTGAIAITPGEPAGIGPDLAVMLAQREQAAPLVYVADPEVLHDRAKQLDLPFSSMPCESAPDRASGVGEAWVLPISTSVAVSPGIAAAENAAYVIETLDRAARGCQRGEFTALVTGPVNKAIINQSGIPFSGHTEYLAGLTGGHPVMMLACNDMRVALATTHLPLKKVPEAIDRDLLETVLHTLNHDLRVRFGIERPRILVCGLNPHAGEAGYLGDEEITTIGPALEFLRTRGLSLVGPLPADTLFTPKYLDGADAVLAMYHDQGLPVLKYAGFGSAVNVTLGLPIVRTSVDHGTAFELAGSGRADCSSLQAAVDMAVSISQSRP